MLLVYEGALLPLHRFASTMFNTYPCSWSMKGHCSWCSTALRLYRLYRLDAAKAAIKLTSFDAGATFRFVDGGLIDTVHAKAKAPVAEGKTTTATQ